MGPGDRDADEALDEEATIDRIRRARALLREVRDRSAVPAIAHTARQADTLCHGMLWEFGVEAATAPEHEEADA